MRICDHYWMHMTSRLILILHAHRPFHDTLVGTCTLIINVFSSLDHHIELRTIILVIWKPHIHQKPQDITQDHFIYMILNMYFFIQCETLITLDIRTISSQMWVSIHLKFLCSNNFLSIYSCTIGSQNERELCDY